MGRGGGGGRGGEGGLERREGEGRKEFKARFGKKSRPPGDSGGFWRILGSGQVRGIGELDRTSQAKPRNPPPPPPHPPTAPELEKHNDVFRWPFFGKKKKGDEKTEKTKNKRKIHFLGWEYRAGIRKGRGIYPAWNLDQKPGTYLELKRAIGRVVRNGITKGAGNGDGNGRERGGGRGGEGGMGRGMGVGIYQCSSGARSRL